MLKCSLDFETASNVSLPEVGVWRYATHPSTKVLLLGWAIDDEPVNLWVPHKEEFPPRLRKALQDPFVIKTAWNTAFERLILKFVLNLDIPVNEWRDTQILARYFSLPSNLEDAGTALGIREDEAKIAEGRALIRLFCESFIEGGKETLFGISEPVYKNWETNPIEWAKFEEYCRQDVVAERHIAQILEAKGSLPQRELENYWFDQVCNDRGISADQSLIASANHLIDAEKENLHHKLEKLTGLANVNSDSQILSWVNGRGYPFSSIGKNFVARSLNGEGDITPECREVLTLRNELAKSSVDKFTTLTKMLGDDGRLHHQFQFYKARTGRWSGTGVQLHNLMRPKKSVEENLEEAVRLIKTKDADGLRVAFPKDSFLDVIASCLRPVFCPKPGSTFYIADLSSIENLVLGWICNCKHILQVFHNGLDPYREFAAILFNKPYDQVTKEERNIAKAPCLAAGYAMSAGKEIQNADGDTVLTGLRAYAKSMGVEMTPEDAERSIKLYKKLNPEVVETWKALENAFIRAVDNKETVVAARCTFYLTDNVLSVTLPSGRELKYFNPKVSRELAEYQGREYTRNHLTYSGLGVNTQWQQIETSRGSLIENLCQAIARDVLVEGIRRATAKGFVVVAHVHDELVCEVPNDSTLTVSDLEQCMSAPIDWAPGLPLKAVGFESEIYRKG